MVAVAQLVESWIVIPVVVGSSPISHPSSPLGLPSLIPFRLVAAVAWVCPLSIGPVATPPSLVSPSPRFPEQFRIQRL